MSRFARRCSSSAGARNRTSSSTRSCAIPGHAYEVIGCTPSAYGKFWVQPPSQVTVLGDYNSLPDIIREQQPDVAIMADLDPVMGEIIALANLCMRENVQFKVIPSYFQTLSSGLHLEHVSGVPVLGVSKLPLDHIFNRIVKRAIDVVGALVGLVDLRAASSSSSAS